jgi:ribulose-bisphosphate carboxylase large chain
MRVTYRLDVDSGEAEARAEELALEQTVEVPRVVVRDPFVAEQIMGRVEALTPDPEGGQRATISYPAIATAHDPAQLMNVVFGNSSLHPDVECVDVELPTSLLQALRGPRFGIDGLRKVAGAHGRPMTCTTLKPMGLSPGAFADLFRVFARTGVDFIKDDHGLAEHAFCPFEERVRACVAAELEVFEETGHRTVYVPNLIGTPKTILQQLDVAEACGARAVMVSPMLIGLPFFWELCQERSSVPVVAHPAFGGVQRIRAEVLFGRILRAYGADAVIFVNSGSRFSPPEAQCRRLAEHLTAPWEGIQPALPVPGGGIAVENAGSIARQYGVDSMLLIGGNLQIEADRTAERCRAFVEAVAAAVDG